METLDRRAFIGALSVFFAAFAGGCSLYSGGGDATTEPQTIRTIDPVRAEGEPREVSRVDWSNDDLVYLLRETVSTRSECITGEPPVEANESRLTITTRAIIPTIEHTNVYFPGNSYYHLKRIAPRSIILSPPDNTTSRRVEVPVFIKAVLLEGDREESVPSTTGECPGEPNEGQTD